MGTQLSTESFWDGCIPVPEAGCWLWLGVVNAGGYGRAIIDGKQRQAHRVSYALAKGQIPDKLLVCHKCDTRLCINPDHLFLGTHKDNTDDMMAKGRCRSGRHMTAKTRCPHGHKYDDQNTLIVPGRSGKTRICKVCMLATCARYRARKKLKESCNG